MFRYILAGIIIISFISGFLMELFMKSPLRKRDHLRFFTIQSNIMVFIVTIISFIPGLFNNHLFYCICLCTTINIIVTNIGFHFLIRAGLKYEKTHHLQVTNYNPNSLSNILLHYIVPFTMLTYFIIYFNHNLVTWYDPLFTLIYPLSYFIISLLAAQLGFKYTTYNGKETKYPYFFLDKEAIGLLGGGTTNSPIGVIQFILILLIAILSLSYILVIIFKLVI